MSHNPDNDWLFGKHSILEAMDAGLFIERIYISKDSKAPHLQHIRDRAKQLNIQVDMVPKSAIDRYAGGIVHQNVAARIGKITPLPLQDWFQQIKESKMVSALLLDGITDTGNFGAICRTANFFSAAVLISSKHPPLSSATVRASSGTLLHTTIVQCPSPKELLPLLRDQQFWIYATSEHSTVSIYEVEIPDRIVWIIGSEDKGVSQYYLKNSDQIVSVPSVTKHKSLNASVAAGIFLFATTATHQFHLDEEVNE